MKIVVPKIVEEEVAIIITALWLIGCCVVGIIVALVHRAWAGGMFDWLVVDAASIAALFVVYLSTHKRGQYVNDTCGPIGTLEVLFMVVPVGICAAKSITDYHLVMLVLQIQLLAFIYISMRAWILDKRPLIRDN